MNLAPWGKQNGDGRGTAIAPLGDFHREMDRIFERFFEHPWGPVELTPYSGEFAPPMNISETDKDVVVKAELPGVDPNQIELKVVGNTLSLSGKKDETKEEKGDNFYRSERVFGSFTRSVQLPETVDADKVNAEFRNGVLTVKMPKKPGAMARKIPVQSK